MITSSGVTEWLWDLSMREIFTKVNKLTMLVSFGISWLSLNIFVSFVFCNNEFSHVVHEKMGSNAYIYFEGLSPLCRLWQSNMDSRFIWHEMSLLEAASYSAMIVLFAAILELTFVNFQRDKLPVEDSTMNKLGYIWWRSLFFIAFTLYAMTTNHH